jgi:hypothetical protein
MKIATWDSMHWDDPNLRWGDPSYLLEPGDPGYVSAPPSSPPTQNPKRNPRTVNTDYIPVSYKNLRGWLTLQQTDLTTALAATLGMTTAERDAFLAAVGTLLPKLTEIVDLMDRLDQKTADLPVILDAQIPLIRAAIKRAKTSPGCTPAIQEQLDWVGAAQNIDPDTARPTITVEAQRGRVKIDGRKPGFEAVNIYVRKKGDVQWKLIAVRKRKFPYYDESPLAVANTPEVREYMAIGVVSDEESGQPSEIKEVVYAG